ncbi:MAG TPA: class I SAM-dependent methyltransferase, partial [Thermoleophilia bacterium]|nr:class I SAM-dependent methyltransferase [Thermoleophilia bacterium]
NVRDTPRTLSRISYLEVSLVTDQQPQHFAGSKAAAYDKARAPLASIYGALRLSTNAVLSPLDDGSRVLCVGAGTGDELIVLAQMHPSWTFAVVEPSSDMLALCREKAILAGVDTRCEFFEGYIDLVPDGESFDAALCLLVSCFIVEPSKREALFSAIATRLRSGGLLVNAELSPGVSAPDFEMLRDAWVAMHRAAGIGMKPDYLGRDVVVSSIEEVETLLTRAGFTESTRFFQALLISAWRSEVRRAGQGDH